MADAPGTGRFVWHDLSTPNASGAHEFYGKALGWKTEPWEDDPSYVMFAARSGPVGGSVESRSVTPHWLPYVSTASVDATIEAAARLGARVLTPATPLPNGGRFASLADPQGAPFGIYSSADGAAAPDGLPQPGEFSWHELATNVAPGIAFGFYAALFDWDELAEHDMGPMGMYLIFGRGGRQLGGMFDKGASGNPGAAYWLGYVSVTDLEGTIERAKAARGSVLTGPMDVPGGDRIAQLMDPYGAFFALHEAAGKAAASKPRAAKPAAKAKTRKKAARPPARKKAAPKKAAPKKAALKTAAPKKRPPARKAAKARPKPKKKAKKRGR